MIEKLMDSISGNVIYHPDIRYDSFYRYPSFRFYYARGMLKVLSALRTVLTGTL